MKRRFEDHVVISGIGQSEIGRRLDKSALLLTAEAAKAALSDAGLRLCDIDGLSTWPGRASGQNGFSPIGITEVKEALGLELNWYCGAAEAPSQFAAIVNACLAVAGGLARHVLCFRTLTEGSARAVAAASQVDPSTFSQRYVDDRYQWQLPFNAFSAANWIAMYAQRHFHDYGTTREQLAQIAINARCHAGLNPSAVYRTPLTMDDYLSARMISTPLCLYDCDVPVDGSTAIIVSARETTPDLAAKPINIGAAGVALHGRDSWDQGTEFAAMAAPDAAKQMWSRTDLKPKDIDVAQLYDGFSYITLAWLEALGFCGRGESGPFIEGGSRIGIGGELPLNTHGGQLSAGRTHGFGFVHEACLQLRGQAGLRQVNGAEVAVAAAGGGPLAGCLLLTI